MSDAPHSLQDAQLRRSAVNQGETPDGTADVSVEIALAFEDAIRIKAKDLDPKLHGLFGTFGQRYELSEVVVGKPWVKTVREDGWADYFGRQETITVWPTSSPSAPLTPKA